MENRIKELRTAKGITQKELADKLSVDRATVAQWERGVSNPRVALLPIIMNALGLEKIDQIFLAK